MSSPLSLCHQYWKYVHGKDAIKARGDSFSGLKIAIFLMCARVILGYVPGNEGRGKKGEGGRERELLYDQLFCGVRESDPCLEYHLSLIMVALNIRDSTFEF